MTTLYLNVEVRAHKWTKNICSIERWPWAAELLPPRCNHQTNSQSASMQGCRAAGRSHTSFRVFGQHAVGQPGTCPDDSFPCANHNFDRSFFCFERRPL